METDAYVYQNSVLRQGISICFSAHCEKMTQKIKSFVSFKLNLHPWRPVHLVAINYTLFVLFGYCTITFESTADSGQSMEKIHLSIIILNMKNIKLNRKKK